MPESQPITDRVLRAFDAAARLGSLTDAARELGISQSGVSHAVAKLEGALGYEVFTRSKSGVVLTSRGASLHAGITVPLADIDRAVARALEPAQRPTIGLSVSTSLASYWLMPRLPLFKRQHPDIELRLITTDSDTAVGIDGADLWIPLGTPNAPNLEASFLCTEELIPVASADVAADVGFGSVDALRSAPLLHLEERYMPRFDWAKWFRLHGAEAPSDPGEYRSNDYSLILQAAIEGQGVALGWSHIVGSLIEQGRLVALAEPVQTDNPFVVLARRDRPLAEGAERLRRWLRAEISEGPEIGAR